ncbi:hypothetical protein HZ326_30910 [Fusarium oxysporum f. sp. albedinis]|nr:hypothetical protein HZ326_30910 [Fusarium oxysporum f. sp. albedinis]
MTVNYPSVGVYDVKNASLLLRGGNTRRKCPVVRLGGLCTMTQANRGVANANYTIHITIRKSAFEPLRATVAEAYTG